MKYSFLTLLKLTPKMERKSQTEGGTGAMLIEK